MPWTFGQYLASAVPDATSLIHEIIQNTSVSTCSKDEIVGKHYVEVDSDCIEDSKNNIRSNSGAPSGTDFTVDNSTKEKLGSGRNNQGVVTIDWKSDAVLEAMTR